MQKAITTTLITLLLMAVTGLSVVVVYQQRELELLRKPSLELAVPEVASIHASSVVESSDKPSTAKQDVHQQLLKTCSNWQRWYSQDGKTASKMNRDNACRRSSEYGIEELGLAAAPIIDAPADGRTNAPEPASSSRVVRIQDRAQPGSETDLNTSSWQQQLERLTGEN